tara:strand:+ start:195 stop:953 length:759 start_codon:yes stop_codon:yes gene_type:complete
MSYFDIKDITVAFGGVKALNNVSFSVNQGEIFTIIGPNGAGKSTLFNVISRIYEPNNGEIYFNNQNISKKKPHQIAGLGIARTFQNLELFENATVLQNLLLGRHIYRKSNLLNELFFTPKVKKTELEHRLKVEEVIDFLDLQHYRDTIISGLPYGVRKNVELARALCTNPKLLLLDEPSSGLTNEETIDLGFWIKDIQSILNITVVMIEHDMSFVNKVSDRILALNYGEIIATGLPEEIKTNEKVRTAYMGE